MPADSKAAEPAKLGAAEPSTRATANALDAAMDLMFNFPPNGCWSKTDLQPDAISSPLLPVSRNTSYLTVSGTLSETNFRAAGTASGPDARVSQGNLRARRQRVFFAATPSWHLFGKLARVRTRANVPHRGHERWSPSRRGRSGPAVTCAQEGRPARQVWGQTTRRPSAPMPCHLGTPNGRNWTEASHPAWEASKLEDGVSSERSKHIRHRSIEFEALQNDEELLLFVAEVVLHYRSHPIEMTLDFVRRRSALHGGAELLQEMSDH